MKTRSTGVLLAMLSLAAAARVAIATTAPARIHVVGAGDGTPALEARLHDLLDDELPGLVVDGLPVFQGDEPFRGGEADTASAAAWLVLEGTHGRLRAAGAGRTRFVFRDLEVGQPLTEFDRERLGQSIKAAIEALVAGGPGVMSRADAAAASGVALPVAAPDVAVAVVAPPPPRFRLGAFYQAQATGGGLLQGAGLIATLNGSSWSHDPELWLSGGYDLPGEFGNQLASVTISALWTRVGVTLRLNDAVRVGVGVGIDRQTKRLVYILAGNPGYVDQDDRIIAAGRLLVRAGPTRVVGVDVSLTAFLEISQSTESNIYVAEANGNDVVATLYRSGVARPGFSLELWWR